MPHVTTPQTFLFEGNKTYKFIFRRDKRES